MTYTTDCGNAGSFSPLSKARDSGWVLKLLSHHGNSSHSSDISLISILTLGPKAPVLATNLVTLNLAPWPGHFNPGFLAS